MSDWEIEGALRAQRQQLLTVIRWALGEEDEFVSPPPAVTDVMYAGKRAIEDRLGRISPIPLYWWRSELRRRMEAAVLAERSDATPNPASTQESPE